MKRDEASVLSVCVCVCVDIFDMYLNDKSNVQIRILFLLQKVPPPPSTHMSSNDGHLRWLAGDSCTKGSHVSFPLHHFSLQI